MYRSDFARCPIDGGEIAPVTTDPLIGTTIGEHYTIEALLGEGAMGRVYRTHHTRLVNKRFALKILLGDLAASATMRIRFAKEAENASKLDHPNIVGVVDFGRTESGLLYIVMELVDGQTLGDLIRFAPVAPARTRRIARQLCAGLAHAHARGVVHRDFKPDNILVIGEGDSELACIADFGLAISTLEEDARLTTSGVVCTPAYAAPEQLVGADIDQRADLYALGVTLFETLTGGIMPFGNDPQAVMSKKLVGPTPSILTLAPHVPATLVAVLDRLLARDPAKRFQTADEVAAALDDVPPLAIAATQRAALPPPPRRRWLAPACFACTCVGGLALALRPPLALPLAPELAPLPVVTEAAPARVRIATRERVPPQPAYVAPRPAARPLTRPPAPPDPDPIEAPTFDVLFEPPASPRRPLVRERAVPASQAVALPQPPAAAERSIPPRIASLHVEGGISHGVVRRAIERVLADVAACGRGGIVGARFTIADARRPIALTADGAGAACVQNVLARVRTEEAPDVGTADVRVRIEYGVLP